MSTHVTIWVYDRAPSDLKPSEMLVALALADHANGEGGQSYPSVPRIAKMCRLGERAVVYALAELVRRGVIEKTREATNRAPAVYKFTNYVRDANFASQDSRGEQNASLGVQILHPNRPITVNQEKETHFVRKEREVSRREGGTGTPQGTGTDLPIPQNETAVPNSHVTHGEEANPYWTEPVLGPRRLSRFNKLLAVYPKREQRLNAMAAFRQVIGTAFDAESLEGDPFTQHVLFGVEWYAKKIEKEKDDPKYTKLLANWIRQKCWLDMPDDVLKEKRRVAG